jgi:hypothetical protein
LKRSIEWARQSKSQFGLGKKTWAAMAVHATIVIALIVAFLVSHILEAELA